MFDVGECCAALCGRKGEECTEEEDEAAGGFSSVSAALGDIPAGSVQRGGQLYTVVGTAGTATVEPFAQPDLASSDTDSQLVRIEGPWK